MCQEDREIIARLKEQLEDREADLKDKDQAQAIVEDERLELENKVVILEKKLFHCKEALESSNIKNSQLREEIRDLQEKAKELMAEIKK